MSGEVRLDRDEAQAILESIRRVTPFTDCGRHPSPLRDEISDAGDLLSAAIAESHGGRTCRDCSHDVVLHVQGLCLGLGCGCRVYRDRIIADNRT